MKRLLESLCIAGFVSAAVSGSLAQAVPATPNQDLRRQMENAARVERDISARMRAMADLNETLAAITKNDGRPIEHSPHLSKKQRERVLSSRKINPDDIANHAVFLRAEKAGAFKLFPDFNCVSDNLIKVGGDCSNFVPESSSFSFRTGKYIDRFYQDIGYNNSEIHGGAFFSQGIFASLGDAAIEQVSQTTPAVATLAGLKTATDPAEAKELAAAYLRGDERGGFMFTQKVAPVENTTYAFRTIAYRLQNSLPPAREDSPMTELRFHSFAFDKRVDAIFIFRIVRIGENGELTVVWKELSRRDAPKIKFPKGEALADFK